jgi:hypothetical protein
MILKRHKKITLLIEDARTRLRQSNDLLHDEGHAARVATYAINIASHMGIDNPRHIEALEISAWWHDVSRTITKKPSFVLMPFIDDTLSAIMLGITIIKSLSLTRSTWLAFRLVLSKSAATGKIFSRVFLTKKMRTLLDILDDADTVDTLAPERTEVIHAMVGSSRTYKHAYKMMTWWFASTTYMEVKTDAAKEYLIKVLQEFVVWAQQAHIRMWHIERYGEEWLENMIGRINIFLRELERDLTLEFST